jgi:DNA-binding PadR family transcriptional regulator
MGKKIPGEVLKYLVLEACDEGATYGYEIVSRIEEITDGNWSPSYGTIYPLIQRMEEKDLVKSLSDEEAEKEGLETGDRKYFAITEEGRRRLEESGEKREKFEELILGYLKVYEHVHSQSNLENFVEDF